MDENYEICKNRLFKIFEESEIIPVLRGKEKDIDYFIKDELREKFPEYISNHGEKGPRYSRIAENILIEFCEKGNVFENKKGKKFKLLERFSVERYRYFVNESVE